ncbi:MAG TPA: glycosyltransferase family 4 protein, partial [Chthoniobacteraceae bacterium]|nr:glycosyltransferase family 4 protein [Chthoniobacteraceae bacterium]
YELRDALRELNASVRLCGPVIEAANFWSGIDTEAAASNWLHGAHCVVLPAWVEHSPRRLLEAIASGVPVVASAACGLDGLDGVTTVATGDVGALLEAIAKDPAAG